MKIIKFKSTILCAFTALTISMNLPAYAEETSNVDSSISSTLESTQRVTETSSSVVESTESSSEVNSSTDSVEVDSEEETTQRSVTEPDETLYFEDYYLPSGRSDSTPVARSSNLLRNSMDIVYAGEANRPKSHFIDISSHNSSISVANFKKMKTYGIKGVVVKLTEADYYTNPFAQEQINNATAAGLKVSAYHYAHYTTSSSAAKEANYFASLADRFKLPKSTIMVIDIEEGKMLNSSLTPNTTTFVNTLKSKGYSNPMYYMNRSYATSGYFSVSKFGAKNMWVAQYPYTPTAAMKWNNEFSAWQWSSQYYIPGIAHPFDISMDYSGYLESGAQGRWLSANQYVTITKKNYSIWSNFNFNSTTNSTTKVYNKTFKVNGKYKHMNGATYYSLYDNNGNWKGYLNAEATTNASGPQGIWLSENKYITLTKKGQTLWGDINKFSSKKGNSTNLYQQTFQAKGKYNHVSGAVYYSLYDNKGTWRGYLNSAATMSATGAQGAWLKENKYVTLTKKGQTLWGNIDKFSSKKGNTTALYQQTYQVKGKYKHFSGAVYYSLYDNKGKWKGYLNSALATSATGPQGAWLKENKYVTLTKKGQTLWGNIDKFSNKKGNTTPLYQQTFQVKGKYNHVSGAVYYSLYDNKGKWKGYLNAAGATSTTGAQGAWIKTNKQVTIERKKYTVWADINTFSKKKGNTTDLYKKNYQVQGMYNHFSGAAYYSIYDKNGTWIGYLNSNATK
ncbi:GH25 family lysozyme [Enterococcus sp. AZ177]|uniref:GH25 family lysozyme n=1 Tax=unclassified Enterococcus TaxID=2608891 RepID=UPI003D2FE1E3